MACWICAAVKDRAGKFGSPRPIVDLDDAVPPPARAHRERQLEEEFSSALRAYCRRDTLAMIEVHRVLMRLAENPNG